MAMKGNGNVGRFFYFDIIFWCILSGENGKMGYIQKTPVDLNLDNWKDIFRRLWDHKTWV